jgi:hypothetical protein
VSTLPGVLTAAQVRATAEHIASLQLADGLITWFTGHHGDPWNHIEAAMALTAAGLREPARAAFAWSAAHQRADGSWPCEITASGVQNGSADTNQAGYLAVGVWHDWLANGERAFVEAMWPVVRAGIDWVVRQRRADGAIRWSVSAAGVPDEDALLIGSSCLVLSLRCALALAELIGDPQPDWELAAAALAHAVAAHPEQFGHDDEQRRYSMHWYYPVLGGALRGAPAAARLASRWAEFVVAGHGVRCVADQPWITGAETCELALALDALGRRADAVALVRDVQFTRDAGGGYQTGWVYGEDVFWPGDLSSWTGAAMILAADALAEATPAHGLFRGAGLPRLAEITRCDHLCLLGKP